MERKNTMMILGRVKKGYQIASGLNPDKTLMLNNTIFLQKPFFISAGIPFADILHNGTVNMNIAPRELSITAPDYEVSCEWLKGVKETFWFVAVKIIFKNSRYEGYIYYPCPSEIKSHKDSVIELLAARIPGLGYKNKIAIEIPRKKIIIK
ncbi:MAG: hypothetical protein HYY92_00840 [Parcubacteria group bacterium]|nr:hypothetical protein [Parcubacteria group bacterium]